MALKVDRISVAGTWWTIAVDDIADLTTPAKLAALDLQQPRPGQHTWEAFQQAGEQLARDGCRGVLYASAARPEHRALCFFRDTIAIPGAEPIRPPETHRDPPAPPTGMRT